ncbi:4Fe-4S binding protein [candidate division KSB1 bacterium]|nr:4Fe-4S binding protein [candidate division KSB1 bacterium]
MQILIYYFSGTGNTEWVARKLARRFHTFGHTTIVLSCESLYEEYLEPELSDMVGLLFPVHSSYPPKIFRDLIRRLPPVINQPLFAITTSGYMAGDTAWKAVQPLKAIGYDPVVLENVIMPNNYHSPPMNIRPVTLPAKIPKILNRAAKQIDQIAIRIQKTQRRLRGKELFNRFLGMQQRWSFRTFESRVNQGFHADGSCTQCGWCVKYCPFKNIQLSKDRVLFLDRCILCMRCYSFCPVNAIQIIHLSKNGKPTRRYSGPENRPFPNKE